jgi:hypothetical protein
MDGEAPVTTVGTPVLRPLRDVVPVLDGVTDKVRTVGSVIVTFDSVCEHVVYAASRMRTSYVAGVRPLNVYGVAALTANQFVPLIDVSYVP